MADLSFLSGVTAFVRDQILSGVRDTSPTTFEEIKPQVEELAKRIFEPFKDGVQIHDWVQVSQPTVAMLMLIAGVTNLSGAQKKALVLDAYGYIWDSLDPDIPWLPNFIDDPIEWGIREAGEVVLEWTYDAVSGKLEEILG